jgi:phospholipid/cholesterol/gamma-HCH transport system substrate-binding protein
MPPLTRRVTRALASSKALFVVALLSGSLTGLGFLGIGEASHSFTARFADVDGLVVGNEVRVAGVAAGQVTAVDVGLDAQTGKQYAQVQAEVGSGFWPLHQGTLVAVKPKGVLSNVFLELIPGPSSTPSLGNNPFFGFNQTQSPVNLDELSNLFDPSVRSSIRTQLQEGVLAFGGVGATNLNQTLLYADPLTRDAVPITQVLATDSPQLDRLNFEFSKISGELSREDSNLRALIPNVDTTLNALAVQQIHLQGTLVHAAGVLTSLDQTFSSAQTQSDLEYLFRSGPNALNCAASLAFYIEPLVANVNPHVPNLDLLLNEFITATGYTGTNGADQSGIDTLRIDPTIPPNSAPKAETATESGGLALEHHTSAYQPPFLPLSSNPQLPTGCQEFFPG